AVQNTTRVAMGFFTLEGSPAFNLDPDKWMVQFLDDFELRSAIDAYLDLLTVTFGGSRKVPPLFDRKENRARITKIIFDDWIYLYSEQLKELQRAADKHREIERL